MHVRPVPQRCRRGALGVALLAVFVLIVAGCSRSSGDWRGQILPDRIALRSALSGPDEVMLRRVYATRGFQPIWMGDETRMTGARQLVQLLQTSDADGLTPAKYQPQVLKKRLDETWRASFRERARTEVLLTETYLAYVHDLHTPAAADDVAYTDSDLQPALRDRAEIARQLIGKGWPQTAIDDATAMNGLYVQMRDALAQQRSTASASDPRLLRNLDRLRALPAKLGDRYVLVDVAANRLWLYQGNQPVDSMKVVVGAPNEQTPQMAALIRYAIYNPFWNVPPDLTRDNYAPRIAANLSALADLRMDAWTGFTPGAQILNPRSVDWHAVARGQAIGWLRQRPGPTNSMGAAKFMLPNELGIYLHDSPRRELFDQDPRFFSAGCIRLEDYRRLSRWLFGGVEIAAQGAAAEQRFDLPSPVPVYIVYLTARVEGNTVKVQPDVYGRDIAKPAPPPGAAAATPQAAAPAPAPAAAPKAPAPRPAAPPVPPAAAVERSPADAASVRLRPAFSPQRPPVPAPAPAAAPLPVAQKSPGAAPVATPVPPAAQRPPPATQRPPVPVPAAPASKTPAPRPAAPPVPTAPVAPRPAPVTAATGACRIQAGVFSQRDNADNLAKTMKSLGGVQVTEMQLKSGVAYSVALTGLRTRKDAESALSKLNSAGVKLAAPRITGCGAAD